MTKKKMAVGPLTNKEKEYILKNKHKGSEYIAKKLSRRIEAIDRFLDPDIKVEVKPKAQPKESFIMNDLLAKRKNYSVVVMTEAASSYMDSKKQQRKNKPVDNNFIHTFRKDD